MLPCIYLHIDGWGYVNYKKVFLLSIATVTFPAIGIGMYAVGKKWSKSLFIGGTLTDASSSDKIFTHWLKLTPGICNSPRQYSLRKSHCPFSYSLWSNSKICGNFSLALMWLLLKTNVNYLVQHQTIFVSAVTWYDPHFTQIICNQTTIYTNIYLTTAPPYVWL